MVTVLHSNFFNALFDEFLDWGVGGLGIQIESNTRDMQFAVCVVYPSPVPEPTTLAIVGLGLAGLGLARRRKK
jgi:hypothetical protein